MLKSKMFKTAMITSMLLFSTMAYSMDNFQIIRGYSASQDRVVPIPRGVSLNSSQYDECYYTEFRDRQVKVYELDYFGYKNDEIVKSDDSFLIDSFAYRIYRSHAYKEC